MKSKKKMNGQLPLKSECLKERIKDMSNVTDNMNVEYLDNAIRMLNTYAKEESLKPLISILEALKLDLHNETLSAELTNAWRNLGIYQGIY